MTSSRFSQKHTAKSYFEEITSFDLFYQLTYMSATAAAGISRARTFQLARSLNCPPAQYFKTIHEVADNLRYTYPDAVRLVGEEVKSEFTKTFLLRLSDALRSGEPLPSFLAREAEVQADHYENDYMRGLESLKKWNDAYSAVTISAALIVVVNMVSTMIYNLGMVLMTGMVFVALAASFGVAWITFRSAPPEVNSNPLSKGCKDQRISLQLFRLLAPTTALLCLALGLLGVDRAWLLLLAGALLLPVGFFSSRADKAITKKDDEISSFLRSLGGTATSRGTTLKDALATIKIDSFPTLKPDIHMLDLRLKAFGKPQLCWDLFGLESGSRLINQTMGIFFEANNLGGDPDVVGKLTSMFAMKTAMLRAQRRGVAGTFTGLVIAMHSILTGLMVFLLGILEQFAVRLNSVMGDMGQGADAMSSLGLKNMFSFNAPQIQFLNTTVLLMVVLLAGISAFAIVVSEGSHWIKITLYLSILLLVSGVCFMVVPPVVKGIM